jgi:hypothetical protein
MYGPPRVAEPLPRRSRKQFLVKAFLLYTTMHSFSVMCSSREGSLKLTLLGQFLSRHWDPKIAKILKLTIHVCLVQEMIHTKLKKKWSGGYQFNVFNCKHI